MLIDEIITQLCAYLDDCDERGVRPNVSKIKTFDNQIWSV